MPWYQKLFLVVVLSCNPVLVLAQPQGEILIRGGDVFTAGGRRTADIRIIGETITEIGTGLVARDERTQEIDARDRLVLPGGIDPHVHLGGSRVDDYTSGSAAALAGGRVDQSSIAHQRPVDRRRHLPPDHL